MQWNISLRVMIVLACAAQCCNVAAADSRSVNIHKPAQADGTVEVENVAGQVQVTGWDRPEVEVTGTIGASVERVDVLSSPGHTTVKVVLPQFIGGSGNGSAADLAVHIPTKSLLIATLVSADVATHGVQGQQQLRTVSGRIDGDFMHETKIDTVSGTVRIAAGAGPLEVNSVSGTITVTGATGDIRVGTVSARIDLTLGAVTRARIHSVSGPVTVGGSLAAGAQLEAESVSGKLRFTLEGPADYDLQTLSGSIDNCFGPKAQRSGYGPGLHLTFQHGAGNARVRLGTQSGAIQLCDH